MKINRHAYEEAPEADEVLSRLERENPHSVVEYFVHWDEEKKEIRRKYKEEEEGKLLLLVRNDGLLVVGKAAEEELRDFPEDVVWSGEISSVSGADEIVRFAILKERRRKNEVLD